MAIRIIKATPTSVRVQVSTVNPDETREWTVDRGHFGSIGAIRAKADNGDICTLGNFRTRDGMAMQPEYARLRKLLAA